MSEHNPDHICLWCFAPLVQGEDEHTYNFRLRNYCNNTHSSKHRGELQRNKNRATARRTGKWKEA